MYDPTTTVLYRPELVAPHRAGYSRSPLKPALWMEHVRTTPLAECLVVDSAFSAATVDDLRSAHTEGYVEALMGGSPADLAESSGNGWSAAYRDSVLMKVGALVAGCQRAMATPRRTVLCPTSGDHHARPERGAGFCPIAGQVIAALRLWREGGLRTAWIDLDEHYGNAIPDGAAHNPEVRHAIPFNVNPSGNGAAYLRSLAGQLSAVEAALDDGMVDLVCIGHGADSHEWDELGGSVTTAQWVEASRMTYTMLARASQKRGQPVPTVMSFFGGYREDDYASVLELHTADVCTALDVLAGTSLRFSPRVSRPRPAPGGRCRSR